MWSYNMNKLLDLEQLIHENKGRERNQLHIFEGVLEHCHETITRYNREDRVRECTFSVPHMVLGKPMYDFDVLVNYLVHHLSDNGLYVEFWESQDKLYISWRDEDINENQYLKRKALIEARQKPIMEGVQNLATSITTTDKYNQARMKQRQREREFRLDLQKKRVPITSTFDNFMKSSF